MQYDQKQISIELNLKRRTNYGINGSQNISKFIFSGQSMNDREENQTDALAYVNKIKCMCYKSPPRLPEIPLLLSQYLPVNELKGLSKEAFLVLEECLLSNLFSYNSFEDIKVIRNLAKINFTLTEYRSINDYAVNASGITKLHNGRHVLIEELHNGRHVLIEGATTKAVQQFTVFDQMFTMKYKDAVEGPDNGHYVNDLENEDEGIEEGHYENKLNKSVNLPTMFEERHVTCSGTARRAKLKKKTRTKKLKKRKHSHFGCSKEHDTDGQILNANHKRPESPQKSTGNTVESKHNDKKTAPKAKTVCARQNPDDLCNTQIQTITSNSDCQSTQAEIDVDQVTLPSYQSQPHVAETMDPCYNSLSNESENSIQCQRNKKRNITRFEGKLAIEYNHPLF